MADLGIVFNEDGVLLDLGEDEISVKPVVHEKNTNHWATDFELGLIE